MIKRALKTMWRGIIIYFVLIVFIFIALPLNFLAGVCDE